jgi:apolipoprotein D and lipocalin family protein
MTDHPPLKTVADLKLPRYLGTWYEIARLPMRHEPEGCTDVSAHYTLLDNGNVGVTNRCRMDGDVEEATGEACAIDNDSARLEVSFLPKGLRWLPFAKGDYWVIQVARLQRGAGRQPGPQVPVAAGPRTAAGRHLQDHYLATARLQGFDLSELIHTPHTGRPTA